MPDTGSFWWWLLVLSGLSILAFLTAGVFIWSRSRRLRRVVHALKALGWRRGLRGGWGLARDRRTPWSVRLLPIPLFLYLAMPFDLVPDFIPSARPDR